MSARPLFVGIAFGTCLCATLAQAESPNDDLYYLLSTQDLSCLKEHATDYAPEDGKISFITVADCQTGRQSNGSLLDQVMNSAPDITIDDATASDTVVALSAADFACLSQLTIPTEVERVAFYPEECNVEAR